MKQYISKKDLYYLAGYVSSTKEFVVWGIPQDKKQEQILYTKAKSMGEAKKVCEVLENKYGASQCRVQVLDLSTPPDFSKTINKVK
jgi:hypothetical protein